MEAQVSHRQGMFWAYLSASLSSTAAILFSYDFEATSGAKMLLKEAFNLSHLQLELVTGSLKLCWPVGAFLSFRVKKRIGMRYSVAINGAIFFVGALLMALGPSYTCLLIGRFIADVGIGGAFRIAPEYMKRLMPPSSRTLSVLTSFYGVISMAYARMLLGYLSKFFFGRLPLQLGWRFMLGAGALPAAFIAVTALAIPEYALWRQETLPAFSDIVHLDMNGTVDSPGQAESSAMETQTAVVVEDSDQQQQGDGF